MPAIRTVEEAVEVAERLLLKYFPFRQLRKAVQEDGNWLVEFDVGVLKTTIMRMKIDADSGDIVEYTSPETV